MVFDKNESPLLAKLRQQYVDSGGQCFVGKDAWDMLQDKAGYEMGMFINKYIYPPINAMEKHLRATPGTITLSREANSVSISGSDGEYIIDRD